MLIHTRSSILDGRVRFGASSAISASLAFTVLPLPSSKVTVDLHVMTGLGDLDADLCTSCETERGTSLT